MKKKTKAQLLHAECAELWKEICFKRDGHQCQVWKRFGSEIEIAHGGPLQVDHCVTRANKLLFYELANGTVVCGSCNRAKGFGMKSIHRAIDQIVIEREGIEKFNEMVELDHKKSANPNFNKVWWLEEQRGKLEGELEQLGGISEWD